MRESGRELCPQRGGIEVANESVRLQEDSGTAVALDQPDPVPASAILQERRRIVQNHQIESTVAHHGLARGEEA